MESMGGIDSIWVFNGPGSNFPAAIFSRRELAEEWIKKHGLTGTLTRYPIDTGTYDWAISKGYFVPKTEEQRSPAFIERFSSASQEHYHYEDGSLG